jgi:signal transduction histidine kinase/ligand-binding sensor domain-containing protein/DNA-binding response OmpR family regulator
MSMQRINRSCILLAGIVLTGSFIPARSGEILFGHLSVEDGLSQSSVNCMLEDRQGFLWFGTQDGLNRFDGYEFTVFRHDSEDPHSLSDSQIWALCEDRSGNLWIGTQSGGLNRYDPATGQFVCWKMSPGYGPSDNTITSIYEDRDGMLWLGTYRGGLNRFDPSTQSFSHWQHRADDQESLSNDFVVSILQDQAGRLWVGTYNGLCLFQEKSGRGFFKRFFHEPNNANSLRHNLVWVIYESPSEPGKIWLGTFAGLTSLNTQTNEFTHFIQEPDNPNPFSRSISSIWEDRRGNERFFWIGSYGGLLRLDLNTGTTFRWTHQSANRRSLSNDQINEVRIDRSGVLWIAGQSGLNFYAPQKGKFSYRSPLDDKSEGFSVFQGTDVQSICQTENGTLWVGTTGGLYSITDLARAADVAQDPRMAGSNIWSLAEGNAGGLWIGTYGGGLNLFQPEGDGVFRRWLHEAARSNSLSHNNVLSICESSSGILAEDTTATVLWIGTEGGLNKLVFDHTGKQPAGEFTRYNTRNGLPNNSIKGILDDGQGHLWISTNNGIAKFDPTAGTFRNYSIADGLQGNEFNPGAAYKTRTGELFFGGINGLNGFRPENVVDATYIPPIVLTDFQIFNQPVAIGPDSPLKATITEAREIVLSHSQNVFSFQFAVLDYNAPEANQYAYKMEGFDNDWVYCGNRRFATYTHLDPGTYVFRVKGASSDGVWNDEGAMVAIVITPPWWRTSWAFAVYALLFVAALYVARRFELNRVRLNNELEMSEFESRKLREVERMKSRFFTNLSHEFRTPLMLILGPVDQLLSGRPGADLKRQYEVIKRNAHQLLDLIEQLLDVSRLEAGIVQLRAKPQELVSLLRGMVSMFGSIAEQKNIFLVFHSEVEHATVLVDQDKLEKIINNLMSNALKFTPDGGRIEVAVRRHPAVQDEEQFSVSLPGAIPNRPEPAEQIEVRVKDSGIGIAPEHLPRIFDRFYQVDDSARRSFSGSGIGLALVNELVTLHRWQISVESEPGEGTEFTLRIPLEKTHPEPHTPPVESARFHGEVTPAFIEEQIPELTLAEAQPREAIQEGEQAADDSPSILIVEDSQEVRAYLSGLLKPAYQILEADNANAAQQVAIEKIPDLIISDVMMPGVDGMEFCRRIKEDWQTCHIPVILLTARASGESRIEGLLTGADDYITKPFDHREFCTRVGNLLDQRRRLREKFRQELTIEPAAIAPNPLDQQFLQRVLELAERHLDNPDFESEAFARELYVSRSQLHRKLRVLVGQGPGEFLRLFRLKRAAQMLIEKQLSVTQIAYAVGFESLSHFTKAFRRQFNCLPSEFEKRQR